MADPNRRKLNRSILIHASELAACIGMNRFKSRQDMVMVYKKRYNLQIADDNDNNSIDNPTIETEEEKKSLVVRNVCEKLIHLETQHQGSLVQEISAILNPNESISSKECSSILADSSLSSSGETKTNINEISTSKIVEKAKQVQSYMSELSTSGKLSEEEAKIVSQEVLGKLSKVCGQLGETDVVGMVNNNSDRNEDYPAFHIDRSASDNYNKRWVCKVDDVNVNVYLGGKVDGIYITDKDDKSTIKQGIVEIKNRVSRLFKRVYDYEKIQVLAYMFIFGMTEHPGKLIERHGNIQNYMIHDIAFDNMIWTNKVKPLITQFVIDVFC